MSTRKTKSLRRYQLGFGALALFCAGAIALNLVVRRDPVRDSTAANDIMSISGAVETYTSSHSRLPADLADVSGLSAATKKRLSDYEYVPGTGYSYQICATFLTDTQNANSYAPAPGGADPSSHGKGYQCFDYEAYGVQPMDVVKPLPVR